jgi:CRP/FNR family cyclic AMP-dependent transcriptional regulator
MVRPERVLLLDADRELARALSAESLRAARDALVVETRELGPGPWAVSREEPEPGYLGCLILEGMLSREVSVLGSRSIELLGPGDLIRPWQDGVTSFADASWRILEPVRLAVLDRAVASKLARWPELVTVLVERSMARARALAIHAAIETIVGLEKRILMLLWQLAERWGRREPDGALVPLRLTHEMLALLAGARRPSVTTALGSLERAGAVVRTPAGYKLLGSPPAGALDLAEDLAATSPA